MAQEDYEALTQKEWNLLLESDIKNLCKYVQFCKCQLPLNELLTNVPILEIYFKAFMNGIENEN